MREAVAVVLLIACIEALPHHHRGHSLEEWLIDSGGFVDLVTGSNDVSTHDRLTTLASENMAEQVRMDVKQATGVDVLLELENAEEALVMGARFNDMPSEGGDRHMCDDPTGLAAFSLRYLFQEKDSVVGQSHHGCRQHWHAMCPVSQTGTDYLFTMDDVKAVILDQMEHWWTNAVHMVRTTSTFSPMKIHLNTVARACALFNIGRILHTVQDSYAAGHVVRANTQDGNNCGGVLYFQGYGLQDHKTHGGADNFVKNPIYQSTFNCALIASARILEQWYLCEVALTIEAYTEEEQEKFYSVYGQPCVFKGSFQPGWRAPLLAKPSTTDPVSRLMRIFEYAHGVTDRSGKPVDIGNLRAGGARTEFYEPPTGLDSWAKSHGQKTLFYNAGDVAQTVTVHFDTSATKDYVPGETKICGETYRGIGESLLYNARRVTTDAMESASKHWRRLKAHVRSGAYKIF